MAGPTCGLMLADLGADVIKVEKIGGGDDTRRNVPPDINGESAAYMMMNRNKRGIVVDLKTDGGREVLMKLLADADVVTENYRPGVMERLGLGYENLKKINPGLIYAAISGFGRSGPYGARAGFDLVAQGMSGLMSVTGERPDGPPVKVGPPVCDIVAGILLALGVVSAYTHRLKTGEGQMVDTSLFEAGVTLTYWQSAIAFATGIAPRALGSAHPLNAPYQAVRTADGYINLGAANARSFARAIEAIGRPDLADDPRFAENAGRMANTAALIAELESVFTTQPSAHWLELFEREGVPAGRFSTLTRCTPTRRSSPATWSLGWTIRWPARCRPSACRSSIPRHGVRSPARRPCSGNTPPRFWPNTATAPRKSTPWRRSARCIWAKRRPWRRRNERD